jgi:hypothetical protein
MTDHHEDRRSFIKLFGLGATAFAVGSAGVHVSQANEKPGATTGKREEWELRGKFFESCSCNVVCPCVLNDMQPHHRTCDGTLVWNIEQGRYRDTDLAGGKFVIALSFSGPINRSPMNIHSYIDTSATKAQRVALRNIIEMLFSPFDATLITSRYVPIRLEYTAKRRSAEIQSVLNLVTKPILSPIDPNAPVELHNVAGPSAPTVQLAIGEVHTYRNEKDSKIDWKYTGRNAYWGAYAYSASMFTGLQKRELYKDATNFMPHNHRHHGSNSSGSDA